MRKKHTTTEQFAQTLSTLLSLEHYSLRPFWAKKGRNIAVPGTSRVVPGSSLRVPALCFLGQSLNYAGWAATTALEWLMRGIYRLYGERVRILSKRIGAVAYRPT